MSLLEDPIMSRIEVPIMSLIEDAIMSLLEGVVAHPTPPPPSPPGTFLTSLSLGNCIIKTHYDVDKYKMPEQLEYAYVM